MIKMALEGERQLEQYLIEQFEWFHRHPELSYEEVETTAKIRELLTEAGIEILPYPLVRYRRAPHCGGGGDSLCFRKQGENARLRP